MNYSDSERVASVLEKLGYDRTQAVEDSDLYIFNTCSIRQKGEDRVYGQLRNINSLKKKNPRLLIGITGCMVRKTSSRNSQKESKDELLRRLPELDFVFRIIDTGKLPEVLEEAEPQLDLPQLEEVNSESDGISSPSPQPKLDTDYLKINPKYTSAFQAFMPIQIGCDKFCTYCIVPFSRGREKSRPMQEILDECRSLVENGCKEITLVGQTVNSYGLSIWDKKSGISADANSLTGAPGAKFTKGDKPATATPEPFVELLTRIDQLKEIGLNRLRFLSSHPRDFTDALIQAHVELETLCNYIHLPVQAGDDQVLKNMNRQYTAEHCKNLMAKIRKTIPYCSISTDIIVGFCGETEEQFNRTAEMFREVRWDMAYLARYSPRPGTASHKAFKDDVTRQEKARRWHILNKILEECSSEKNRECEGRTFEVLVEKYTEETGECEGKSRESKVVQFKGTPDLIGKIVQVKITKGLQWMLKGEPTYLKDID